MRIQPRPPQLVTVADMERRGIDPKTYRRAYERGEVVRVKRGAYCDRVFWEALDPMARHRLRVHAYAETRPGLIFSHASAAALLGLPLLDAWSDDVHVVDERSAGGRSEPGIRRHCVGITDSEVQTEATLAFTAPLRTLADLAKTSTFASAVAAADAALRHRIASVCELPAFSANLRGQRGASRVARVFEFASPLAENAGESLSRVRIHELGFPAPQLQVEHPRGNGRSDRTDFEWPEFQHIGEFDGKGKYLKPEYLRGQAPGEAVYQEKLREDRLRRAGFVVSRWGWHELMHPELLARILQVDGLRRTY